MLAVITRESVDPAIPQLPIAGRALVLRQLQWLRACGFDQVAVEVPEGSEGQTITRIIDEDPLGWDVVSVATAEPLASREVARRAGFSDDVPLCALSADVLGGGDLAKIFLLASSFLGGSLPEERHDLVVQFQAPIAAVRSLQSAELRLVDGCPGPGRVVEAEGWGVRITCAADAIALGALALDQGQGMGDAAASWMLLHAAERSPGVWVARGAHIDDGAEVIAPAFVGSGAIVRAGARIGPRVFLGERSVVERGTELADVLVARDTIVGEGLTARDAVLTPLGLRSSEPDGIFLPIDDPLLLAVRRSAKGRPRTGLRLISVLATVAALVSIAGMVLGS